jgi:hypothetical protein
MQVDSQVEGTKQRPVSLTPGHHPVPICLIHSLHLIVFAPMMVVTPCHVVPLLFTY